MTKGQNPLQQVVLRQAHTFNTHVAPQTHTQKLISKYIDTEKNLNALCAKLMPSKYVINSKYSGYK